MSPLANTPPVQPPQYPHYVYPANDEIDLKELFAALWQGKWLITIITLLFSVAAIVYALNAQEWWSAKATVSQPQLQGIASYQQAVKRYQPLFDVYQEDGTIIVSNALDSLIDPKLIFQQFIQTFNANGTKRRFMQTNPTFLTLQKQVLAQTNDPEVMQKLYEEWFERIQASAVDKKANDIFTLSFQSADKASSLTLLNDYIQFVNQTLNQHLNDDLLSTLATKYGELTQQEKNLLQQAQLRLHVELERTQYALNIAEAADIKQPVQNLGEQELFAINIGSRALKAKVDALKSIKDLSVFEPRLAILQSKLSQFDLETLSAETKWSVNGFFYLDQPEQPLTRDKPKRALIIVLGGMLGGMLGVAMVLVRFAFRREEEVEARS
ncbi:LPS chain length-determining protein [Vibrio cholerae]|uniref:LPS O-antigen chain length determinant protein WzzB n=1 Tax=Vibrio TaxID=662 RepID=UPI000DE40834|nr:MULTISPECIES: Wzz/FepE/Etk N-terminal domain-containing protein [Vibrio]EJL6979301.1 LPS O-antigen chain length determinant protein WzzB [Vibrio cholerae]EKF9280321.1 LPS O-antigen chain length determinant protein WzzB [Vibrio cholerae]ELJ8548869.1 LPS O-antigen chain length determinant protein WzzB [Vibrio cholerae]ELY5188750.1 LPS O-antigen chain length determinant protein WzzB [Vibrio cholerae]ELY5288810.1 LPS O-antigen chain length determinant protein WzzB [Vibrio cholerae]